MVDLYQKCLFLIYASQCENCPNILLEAMRSGCKIGCSNSKPMPEFAGNSVIYFDPTKVSDILRALNDLNINLDKSLSNLALENSQKYDWRAAINSTWKFITLLENKC